MTYILPSFSIAYESTPSYDNRPSNSTVYGKLLTLDSVFYQPTRWKSDYVRQLTRNLSMQDSIKRRKETSIAQTGRLYESSSLATRNYNRLSTIVKPPRHYTSNTATTRDISTKANTVSSSNMIKTMHQFSTIKTTYSDSKKSFVSEVCPQRAMLVQVDFEVFGDVSGVFFTKYAKSMCDNLNIKGWIRVSPRGTVYGQIQGEKEKVDEMALWLRLQGSPGSKIDYCQFKNWQILDSCNFRNFNIRY